MNDKLKFLIKSFLVILFNLTIVSIGRTLIFFLYSTKNSKSEDKHNSLRLYASISCIVISFLFIISFVLSITSIFKTNLNWFGIFSKSLLVMGIIFGTEIVIKKYIIK